MIVFISWLWAGLIIGISFIATPAKFLAETPSFGQLLEVGKVTFNTFRYIEIFLFILLSFYVIRHRKCSLVCRYFLLLLGLLMIAQYGYLLPSLDARVDSLVQGLTVDPSLVHVAYVDVELLKLVALLITGMVANRNMRGT